MCAIFIASIGLNMNSTAVIIGAMLISPLMTPIIGLGFGLAIFDKVGAVRLGLENSIHFFHLTSRAETLHTGRLTNKIGRASCRERV